MSTLDTVVPGQKSHTLRNNNNKRHTRAGRLDAALKDIHRASTTVHTVPQGGKFEYQYDTINVVILYKLELFYSKTNS